jgi:hypothetical protein
MAEEAPIDPFKEHRGLIRQPPLLFAETQALLAELGRKLGFPVVSYWSSERGSLCDNDTVVLSEVLHDRPPFDHLGLFMKSSGGSVESSLKFVHVLRTYARRVTVLIAGQCASAATIVALGADEIMMGPGAYLTPIDSSMRHQLSPIDQINNSRSSVSSDEIARIIRLWQGAAKDHHQNPYADLFQYVHPLVVGAIDRSMSLSVKICREVLGYHMKDEAHAAEISRRLNSDYPSHSYPITSRQARGLGLTVVDAGDSVNQLLLALNKLYSETTQRSLTDFDPQNYHDNEVLNIIEASGSKTFWQNERDHNYLVNERRWQTLNDRSSWRSAKLANGEVVVSDLHIR